MNRPPKKTIVAALTGSVLALATCVAHAAGLGKLTVNSALGQSLSAEIELVSLQPGEFEALSARVASPEAYNEARIEYSGLLRQLRFAVERRADGQAILRVTSNAPINEPFLDVLVELSWPSGRLVREYPILLDPPGFNEARVQPPVAAVQPARPATPPVAAPTVPPPAPTQTSPIIQPVLPPIQPTGVPSARAETGGKDTYAVKRGDTLAKIANEMKAGDVSLDQMLVALFRENRSAFINNNMNLLKSGQILRIPSAGDASRIGKTEAQKEVRVQVADWKSYRDQVAGAVTTAPAKPSTAVAATNQASGSVTSAKPVVSTPAPASDQLKIAKAEPTGKATPGGAAAKGADAAAAKDTAVAKQKELAEAQSRIAELEKQKADAQKLAALKADAAKGKTDTPVAQVTPPVTVPPPAAVAAAAAKAEAAKPTDAKPASDAKPADAKPADAAKPGDAKPADTKIADAKPADAAKTPPKPAAKPAAAPPPPKKEPGLMDMAMENLPIIGGAAGLGVLGVGGLLFLRRRRQASGATTQSSSLMPSDLKPSSSTGGKAAGLVDTGNSSFLTDFDKAGPGSIDTDEVDPVAEAEVYIAYGRDAQAEEILKEALTRDRNRHEISLKLLEIYHSRRSAAAFESVARELKDAVGVSSPMWAKAASMGVAIDPANPLYADGQSYEATGAFTTGDETLSGAEGAKPDVDFDLGFDDPTATKTSAAIDITAPTTDQPAAAADGGLDFDLGFGGGDGDATHVKAPEMIAAAPEGGDSGGLDFDLGFGGDAPASAEVSAAPAAASDAGGGFDFDLSSLSLEGETAAPAPAPTAAAAPVADGGMDLSKFSLDLGDTAEAATPAASEGGGPGAVATKIELAKAYIEIGDTDGAKEILNEVSREGSPSQQDEARKLLAGL